jgi:hypothetical protein
MKGPRFRFIRALAKLGGKYGSHRITLRRARPPSRPGRAAPSPTIEGREILKRSPRQRGTIASTSAEGRARSWKTVCVAFSMRVALALGSPVLSFLS